MVLIFIGLKCDLSAKNPDGCITPMKASLEEHEAVDQ